MKGGEVTLASPNSIVFVADPTAEYEIARNFTSPVTSTKSSIAIGTLAEMDGVTTIRLAATIAAPEGVLVFDDTIETPGKQLAVFDSGADPLLSTPVAHTRTRVRIWVNDRSEPNLVLIEAR